MGGCGVPGATTSPHSLKPSNVPGKGCRNSPLVMGCLINREGSDKSPLGTVPTCPSREGVLDPARALGATSPPPGSSVQPEFWGMQGMRRDFCWPGCGRGLWSPAVGGCSLGMTLREGPLYPPPPPSHTSTAGRFASCSPTGQPGPWVHRALPGLSSSSASAHSAAPAHPHGPGHGAGTHRPPPARRAPRQRVPRECWHPDPNRRSAEAGLSRLFPFPPLHIPKRIQF